jgi:hypothetical protein
VTERSGYSSRIPSVLIMLFVMSWSLFFEFSDNALLLWLFCSPGFVVCVVCCISGCFSSLPVVVVAAAKTREGCFVTRRRCACIEEARAPLRSREKESKGMTACWFGVFLGPGREGACIGEASAPHEPQGNKPLRSERRKLLEPGGECLYWRERQAYLIETEETCVTGKSIREEDGCVRIQTCVMRRSRRKEEACMRGKRTSCTRTDLKARAVPTTKGSGCYRQGRPEMP